MKPISTYFITPPINTELTKSDVSNQVFDANIQAHVVLEVEVSNEQTANEGFDANILHAPGDEHTLLGKRLAAARVFRLAAARVAALLIRRYS